MPVRKGKSAGAVVVIGWHVSPKLFAVQEDEEIAVVDAVGMLVQKDEGLGRGRPYDLRIFSEGKILFDEGRVPTVAVHVPVHRDAPDARVAFASDGDRASVRRAFVDAQ